MSERPLVSIVTPTLNPGERLVRCLDSVAAQTYPNVEHLVVDGGSTDSTIELLQKRGVRFQSEADGGQTHAINKGFALARGEWLGWLNADDVLRPQAVDLAMVAARRTPEAGWIYGDCEMQQDGKAYRVSRPLARIDACAFEAGNNPVPQPGSLVASWALERIGPLDEELHLVMDFDLWLRLVDAAVPSVYVPETLAIFELHDDSKTGRTPYWKFLMEAAQALAKSGRHRSAALVLGRVTALRAAERESSVSRPQLRQELDQVAREQPYPWFDRRLVAAVARIELGIPDLLGRPRRVRHLLSLDPWVVRETRLRLLDELVLGVRRRLAAAMRRRPPE